MSLTLRHYALLAVIAFCIALPGRLSLPPLDRDEPRYMQATAQMLSSGNFLDIRFQDQPRYLQPAGIYWLEATAVKTVETLTGDKTLRHQSWPYRLPSLIASTLSIALTCWIGARLFSAEAGILGALLLLCSTLFAAESRMATIDSVLLLNILSLEALLLHHFQNVTAGKPTPTRFSILYWGGLGIGLMLKGPIILIPALGTIGALCLSYRSLALWRALRPAWGWLISLAILLPWCISIAIVSHGEFFRRAVGHNLLGKITHAQETHGFPPGYYLLLFIIAFWPGAIFALRALPTIWQQRNQPSTRFLLCWIIPHWVFFEALATKLPHYVLPTYPAIAILTAAALTQGIPPIRALWVRLLSNIYAILWALIGFAFCGVGLGILYKMEGLFAPSTLIPLCGSLPLICAAIWLFYKNHLRESAFCAIGTAMISQVGIFLIVIPQLTSIQLSPRIAKSFEQIRPCANSALISPSYREPSLVFLTGGATRLLPPGQAAQNLHDNAQCDLALIDARDEPLFKKNLAQLGEAPLLYDQYKGLNYSNGHKMSLTLYGIKPQK